MRRKRVTGRFFLFLLALLVIAFLILRPRLFPGSKETVIMMANADQRQTVDCVIIRDESVTLAESTARVEYIAPENSLVTAGTTVANLYATGYSESLLNAWRPPARRSRTTTSSCWPTSWIPSSRSWTRRSTARPSSSRT